MIPNMAFITIYPVVERFSEILRVPFVRSDIRSQAHWLANQRAARSDFPSIGDGRVIAERQIREVLYHITYIYIIIK